MKKQLTRRYVGMGTANDLMLPEPVRAQRAQKAQRYHALFRVKNVVYDAFEVKSGKEEEKDEEEEEEKLSLSLVSS